MARSGVVLAALALCGFLAAVDAQTTNGTFNSSATSVPPSTLSTSTLLSILIPSLVGGTTLLTCCFYMLCRHKLQQCCNQHHANADNKTPGGTDTNVGNITNVEILPISVTKNYMGGFEQPIGPPMRQSFYQPAVAAPGDQGLTQYLSSLQVNGPHTGAYTSGSSPSHAFPMYGSSPTPSFPMYGNSPSLSFPMYGRAPVVQ